MLANPTLFDLMVEVYNDTSLRRAYNEEIEATLDGPYTLYGVKAKVSRKAHQHLPNNHLLGRLVVTSDGHHWIGLRHSWALDDDRGPKIQAVYEAVYQAIEERWAYLKNGR